MENKYKYKNFWHCNVVGKPVGYHWEKIGIITTTVASELR